ncbi:MAG: hypothetical protein WCK34_06390 [Bacteroidota bacterium]
MKTQNIIHTVILILAFHGLIYSQEADMLKPGPKGMFVFTGKNIPNGTGITAIKIERKSGQGDFKTIAELKFPPDYEAFSRANVANHELFPHQEMPAQADLRSFYAAASRVSLLDSVSLSKMTMAERLSAGNVFYDPGITPQNNEVYRVTHIGKTGNTVAQFISKPSGSIPPPKHEVPVLTELHNQGTDYFFTWTMTGEKGSTWFTVYRILGDKQVECKGTMMCSVTGDTTRYSFTMPVDHSAVGNHDYFCMIPFDRFENRGAASAVCIMEPANYSKTTFISTRTRQVKEQLGILVSWRLNHTEGTRRVEVLRSDSFDKNYQVVASAPVKDTTYFDPDVIPDKIYYYHLKAVGSYPFQVKESNYFSGSGMDPEAPLAPVILHAIPVKKGVQLTIRLNGHYVSGIRVYRNDGKSDSLQSVSDLVRAKDTLVTFTDTSNMLDGYRYYTYRVKSESTSHILSGYSEKVFLRAGIPTIPGAPAGLHGWIEARSARLYWNTGDNPEKVIMGYHLCRTEVDPVSGVPTGKVINLTGDGVLAANNLIDSTIEAGKSYQYDVRTVDINNGESKSSARLILSLKASIPIPPAGLQAMPGSDGIVLEWGSAVFDNFSFYRIYRYQRGKSPELIKLADKKATTWQDTTAIPGQLYFYYLTSIDKSDHESEASEEAGIIR